MYHVVDVVDRDGKSRIVTGCPAPYVHHHVHGAWFPTYNLLIASANQSTRRLLQVQIHIWCSLNSLLKSHVNLLLVLDNKQHVPVKLLWIFQDHCASALRRSRCSA